MLESSGFRKYSTLVVFQLFYRRLCLFFVIVFVFVFVFVSVLLFLSEFG